MHSKNDTNLGRMRGGVLKTAGFALALWVVFHASAAQAVYYYLLPGSNDWNSAASWSTNSAGSAGNGLVPDYSTDPAVRSYVGYHNYQLLSNRTVIVSNTVPEQGTVYVGGGGVLVVRSGGTIVSRQSTQIGSVFYTGQPKTGELRIEGGFYGVSNAFYVAHSTASMTGTVNITGGELKTFLNAFIGNVSNGLGRVSISGGQWTMTGANRLTIGGEPYATGELNLSGTGVISNFNGNGDARWLFFIGEQTNAAGTFRQSGGKYVASTNYNGLYLTRYVSSTGTYAISGGLLDLSKGASVSNGLGTARFEVDGKWEPAITNIRIGGKFTLNTALCTLAVKANADGVEQINVSGSADLSNSVLEVSLADGYTVATPTTLDLLTATTITTSGMTLDQSKLPAGYSVSEWSVVDGGNGKILKITIKKSSPLGLYLILGADNL